VVEVVFGDPTEFVVEGGFYSANCAVNFLRREHGALGSRSWIVDDPDKFSGCVEVERLGGFFGEAE
jgi:hypothetical protein